MIQWGRYLCVWVVKQPRTPSIPYDGRKHNSNAQINNKNRHTYPIWKNNPDRLRAFTETTDCLDQVNVTGAKSIVSVGAKRENDQYFERLTRRRKKCWLVDILCSISLRIRQPRDKQSDQTGVEERQKSASSQHKCCNLPVKMIWTGWCDLQTKGRSLAARVGQERLTMIVDRPPEPEAIQHRLQ